MSQIIFKSKEHRDFFLEMMSKCKVNDCFQPHPIPDDLATG